jgi:peptide/nickel transport system substrate-binding protein
MHRTRHKLILGVVVTAVMSLIVAGASGGASPQKQNAGIVLFGAEQEPPCLNGTLAGCNNTWTSWTVGIALRGLYQVMPDFSAKPDMAAAEGKVLKRRPFTLEVRIQPKARWSDGRQVTVNDVRFTHQLLVNPNHEVASRSGWDQISRIKAVNSKTARITFKKPVAAWKVMLTQSLFPQHALTGANFNEVWNNNYNHPRTGQSMANGPFKLESYTRGQSIVMTRNSTYFGKRPSLDRITFRFITNTDSEIQAIRGGEVDVIYPQPQLQLAQLRGQSGLKTVANAGSTLEHIDMNRGSGNSNPLLGQRWFRQAIAYSLDRKAMVNQLFRTLKPGLPVLEQNTYTNQQKGQYQAHYGQYKRNVSRVNQLFQSHGCNKGGDGIWVCGGQRASVRFGTTAGNRLRELALEIMQAQAKSAGIEFRPDSQPSRLFFARLPTGNYDLALFAWVGSGDPFGQTDIYGCGGESNWKGYCNNKVTRLFKASDAELNAKRRTALVNSAEKAMAKDAITIPLYQKPTYLVYKTKLGGLVDNPTNQGPTWNTPVWRTG